MYRFIHPLIALLPCDSNTCSSLHASLLTVLRVVYVIVRLSFMLHFVLWLAHLTDSSKVLKVGGKQKPYQMWNVGISLVASLLANSSQARPVTEYGGPLTRSRILPATQA